MFDHLDNKQNKTNKENHENNRAEDLKIKKNISRLSGGRSSTLANHGHNSKKLNERIKNLEKKGKKRGKCFSLIGIIGGLLIALLVMYAIYFLLLDVINISGKIDENTANIPDILKNIDKKDILPIWKKCELDSDCAITRKGCCECSSGGFQEAINKNYLEEWNSKLSNNCHTVICPQLYRCEEGLAICDNGECIFKIGAVEEFIKEELLDSDNDGLKDYEEINVYFTDPELSDTDGDGYSDGDEVNNGYNPLGE